MERSSKADVSAEDHRCDLCWDKRGRESDWGREGWRAVVRRFQESGKNVSITDKTVLCAAVGEPTVTRNHLWLNECLSHTRTNAYIIWQYNHSKLAHTFIFTKKEKQHKHLEKHSKNEYSHTYAGMHYYYVNVYLYKRKKYTHTETRFQPASNTDGYTPPLLAALDLQWPFRF